MLLDDRKFSAKSALSILGFTKISNRDEKYLFQIVEKEEGNEFSVIVKFKGEKLFKSSINYGKYDPRDAVGMIRNKILERIVVHFCGK